MNRYSRCVQYLESKLNHDKDGFVLDKIGMTADEVRTAMKKYSKLPEIPKLPSIPKVLEAQPIDIRTLNIERSDKGRLTKKSKALLKELIQKGDYSASALSKAFGLKISTILYYQKQIEILNYKPDKYYATSRKYHNSQKKKPKKSKRF